MSNSLSLPPGVGSSQHNETGPLANERATKPPQDESVVLSSGLESKLLVSLLITPMVVPYTTPLDGVFTIAAVVLSQFLETSDAPRAQGHAKKKGKNIRTPVVNNCLAKRRSNALNGRPDRTF